MHFRETNKKIRYHPAIMNCVSAPFSKKILPKKELIISEGSLEISWGYMLIVCPW